MPSLEITILQLLLCNQMFNVSYFLSQIIYPAIAQVFLRLLSAWTLLKPIILSPGLFIISIFLSSYMNLVRLLYVYMNLVRI